MHSPVCVYRKEHIYVSGCPRQTLSLDESYQHSGFFGSIASTKIFKLFASETRSTMTHTNKDLEKTKSGQVSRPMSTPAHALSCEALVAETGANIIVGLTNGEARARLETHGLNDLGEGPGVQPARILVRQIANAMMLVRTSRDFPEKAPF